MRKKLFLNKFFALAIFMVVLTTPLLSFAQPPVLCPPPAQSVGGVCLPDRPGGSQGVKEYGSVGELVRAIIDVALLLVASVALIFVIIGGYQYLTANGKEEQVKAAKTTIIRALLGLLIVLFAYAIVVLVVKIATG